MAGNQQREDTRQFLEAVFPVLGKGNLIELRVRRKWRMVRLGFFARVKDALQAAVENAPAADVHFGVGARRHTRGGTKEDLSYIRAVWADVDAKCFADKGEALAAASHFAVPPSIIVDSGGGFHAYWLLDEPFFLHQDRGRMDLVEGIMRGIRQGLQAQGGRPLDSAWNVDRLLRIPGTLNHKLTPSRPVEIVEFGPAVYRLTELEPLHQARPSAREAAVEFGDRSASGQEALHCAVELGVSRRTVHLIRTGNALAYGGDRSARDAAVVTGLLAKGVGPDDIRAIFDVFPVGDKYREPTNGERYLALTIHNVGRYLEANPVGPRGGGSLPEQVVREIVARAALPRVTRLLAALDSGPATAGQLLGRLGWARNTVARYVGLGQRLGIVEVARETPRRPERGTRGRPPGVYRLSSSAPAWRAQPWLFRLSLIGRALRPTGTTRQGR